MGSEKNVIRLIIVDDHPLSREGIKALLSDIEFPGMVQVVGSGREALEHLSVQPFDVALVDINMPEMTGIELTREIRRLYPSTRVIALSMYDDPMYVSQMMNAGASGYILKNISLEELLEAVDTVFRGSVYLSRQIEYVLRENVILSEGIESIPGPKPVSLSHREQEILSLVAKECTNQEIACQLFISERTVETHRKNLLIKTKQKTVIGLIKYAIEHQIFKLL